MLATPHTALLVACKPGGLKPQSPALAATASTQPLPRTTPRLQRLRAFSSPCIQQKPLGQQRRQPGLHAWRPSVSCRAMGSDDQQQAPLLLSSSDEASFAGPVDSISASSSGYTADSEDGSMAGSSDGDGVSIDLQLPRRSLLVKFTCNVCSGRSERLVNPVAWNKGLVIAQCQQCEAWHKLADAANLVEEIRYADLEDE